MKSFRWPTLALGVVIGLLAAGLVVQSDNPWIANAQLRLPDSQQSPAVPGAEHAEQLSGAFRAVSRQALPAVVSIKTTGRIVKQTVPQASPFDDPLFRQFFGDDPRFRQFRQQQPQEREFRLPGGQGSGFIVSSDGIVMTNRHVVADTEEVIVRLSDGREYVATDIRSDERSDVAVVKIDVDEQLPFLPLGHEDDMEIGDWVLAFGSPFGLDRTVTQGIISAKSRAVPDERMSQEFLQTDAAINPGNSGGPLVNLRGEVIGVNTAISTSAGGYDGVGFAVPVSMARWVADQLLADGEVERAYVGIQMQEIDPELGQAFNLKVPNGVVVTGVVEGAPADEAGFSEGDVILEVNGRPITNYRRMLGTVERLQIGESYNITILRNGQKKTLSITVAKRPDNLTLASGSSVETDDSQNGGDGSAELAGTGISIQDLTNTLAAQLGIPDSSGVVITSVDPDSSGARAGLSPGMVITRVGSRPVRTVADAEAALQESPGSEKVLLLVRVTRRDGQSQSLFVTVDVE